MRTASCGSSVGSGIGFCVSGHEIFPDDIERVLQDCEGVLEVACVGVPDDKTGQAIKIAVVRKPGAELTGENGAGALLSATDRSADATAHRIP
jgi:acyl-CoA synthetase (AMP-forming)/AMP-acid ligase II